MKNNYLIESSDKVLLDNKINEIITKSKFNDVYISTYDIEENDLSDALEDLNTYGLFSEKKVIIIKNVFVDTKNKKLDDLINYINNYDENYLLILVEAKLDNRLTIIKDLKSNKNIEIISLETNPNTYIKNYLKDYKIDSYTVNRIISLCKEDITRITNELDKLMMYKVNNKEITIDDVNLLVVEKLGDSSDTLFSLIRYIMSRDKVNAINTLNKLKKYDVDINSIIGLMTSQINLIWGIKILSEKGINNDDIAKTLGVKSVYQIKKLKEYIYDYSYEDICSFIKTIADLDYKIKSGRVDKEKAIEILIINL